MTQLIADEATLAVLSQAQGLAEVRDASGNIVGYYAPISVRKARLFASAAAHIDPEEIQRRKAANLPGRSTREVFEHLLTLAKDQKDRDDLQRHIQELAERDRCDSL
jgi:hypothetical protein